MEAPFRFPGVVGGGATSSYVVGGRKLNGEIFYFGLNFDLTLTSNSINGLDESTTGSAAFVLAGLDYVADGRLVLTSTSRSGEIWLNVVTDQFSTARAGSYLINVDQGRESAITTTLLSGNRILVGGRAEELNSSNEGGKALLLAFDLDAATVSWARTYHNAAYPESAMLDVYADDDGFLLSGYGITLFGTTAGGFLGDLPHWDSWLAATDTTGRVFDCDCYTDTYATVSPITVQPGFVGIDFLTVNKGQDDLPLDPAKATIANYFCDQYQPVVSPVCCGGEDRDRVLLADATQIDQNGQDWIVRNDTLPGCFELIIDWGDGTVETVTPGQLPASHQYVADGNFRICITYRAIADDGSVCWEETRCNDITGTDERRSPVVNIKVYPNPTDGMLAVRFPDGHGEAAMRLFNAEGRPVKQVASFRGKTISLEGLPAGTYLLQLRFKDGAIARRRVVLTR